MKFEYTRIVTEDVRGLAAFYEKLLGTATNGNDDYVELHPGGALLAIMSRQSAVFTYGGEWPAKGNGAAILEFLVDDVDAERKRIEGYVSEWVLEPKDMPWGNRSMMFRDPDGNVINFFRPIKAAL